MTMTHARTLMTFTAAVLLLGLALPAAAEDMDKPMQKVTGKVVMVSPTAIHLEVDGEIRQFELEPASKVDPGTTQGDRVTLWYKSSQKDGRVTVTRSERGGAMFPPGEWKTVEGTVAYLSPSRLHVNLVGGDLREIKLGSDTTIEDDITLGDRVNVRYFDQDMSAAQVRLMARPSRSADMREPESSGETKGMEMEKGEQEAMGSRHQVAEARRPGDNAPDTGSWAAVGGADNVGRLPQTASSQPTLLLLGLASILVGSLIVLLGRVRS